MPKYYPSRVICLSDLGNILAYYLEKTTLLHKSNIELFMVNNNKRGGAVLDVYYWLQSVNIVIDPECMAHREDIINKKHYHV